MSQTLSISTSLSTETCCACGVLFAMPTEIQKLRRDDGQYFYCPFGHQQHYSETTVTRLQRQLEIAQRDASAAKTREQSEREQKWAAERERDKVKRAAARMKKRVAAGVCPCCNRSFENLQRHMHTKHPDFAGKSE